MAAHGIEIGADAGRKGELSVPDLLQEDHHRILENITGGLNGSAMAEDHSGDPGKLPLIHFVEGDLVKGGQSDHLIDSGFTGVPVVGILHFRTPQHFYLLFGGHRSVGFIQRKGFLFFRIVAGIQKSPRPDVPFRREAERPDPGLVAIPEVKKEGLQKFQFRGTASGEIPFEPFAEGQVCSFIRRMGFHDSMTALYDAIGQTWHRVTAEAKPHHKLFFAVFTDGLENASKEFSAEMVSEIIERCGAKGWEFRFFCRYEERLLYKTRFNLADKSICSMSLNEEGFREMNNQVMCCMERMLDLPEEEQEMKPGK